MSADPEDSAQRQYGVHMWEPLRFTTPEGYDYLRGSRLKRIGYELFRLLIHGILWPLDRVCWGFRIRGRENLAALDGRGAVSVCNHVHAMDCTFIDLALRKRRVYYVTLESNFRIPGIRRIIRWLDGVPLSKQAKPMSELFRQMETAVKDGDIVQIYPEGELLPGCRSLRDFQDGAFYLAAKSGAPILPMLLTLPEGRRGYTLRILPPVEPPAGGRPRESAAALRDTVRARMQAALDEAAEEQRRR